MPNVRVVAMAMYGYPGDSKPDPQAQVAIHDLCAK